MSDRDEREERAYADGYRIGRMHGTAVDPTVALEAHERLIAADVEIARLHQRIKNMAADVNERLDWIVRDKRESDKVLSGVSTARSVLIRYVLLSLAPDAREALNGGDR